MAGRLGNDDEAAPRRIVLLEKGLDEVRAKGWTAVGIKDDRTRVLACEK
jgi:ABC-type Fe3+-citrate transport system substrate-binding protein